MTSGSDPNRPVHASWLNSTTGGAPSAASAAVKSRPSRGVVPSNEKSDGVTAAPERLPSGRFQETAAREEAASGSKDPASAHSRRNCGFVSVGGPVPPGDTCPASTIASESGYGRGRKSRP